MRKNIKSTNFEMDLETSQYLDKKLAKVEKVVRNDEALCDIEIGRTTMHHTNGDIFRAEINCHVKGKSFRAVSERESLQAANDEMKDGIIREISSKKSKEQTLLRRGGAKIKNILKGIYTPFKKLRKWR